MVLDKIADGSGVVDVDGSGREAGVEGLTCQGLVAGKRQRATVDQVKRALAAQAIHTRSRDDDVVEALGLVALDDHHVDIVVARQQLARGISSSSRVSAYSAQRVAQMSPRAWIRPGDGATYP